MASDEEAQMRVAVEGWGRVRWPGCRVMHELQVGGCRIDLAFVTQDHIAGVEIKSSRDTLDRLDRQIRHYRDGLPEVWLAIAPRWILETENLGWRIGRVVVIDGIISESFARKGEYKFPDPATADRLLTGPLLHLLLKPELIAICRRLNLPVKTRNTSFQLIEMMARRMTGDQLVQESCRELRARRRGWQSDEPMEIAA